MKSKDILLLLNLWNTHWRKWNVITYHSINFMYLGVSIEQSLHKLFSLSLFVPLESKSCAEEYLLCWFTWILIYFQYWCIFFISICRDRQLCYSYLILAQQKLNLNEHKWWVDESSIPLLPVKKKAELNIKYMMSTCFAR